MCNQLHRGNPSNISDFVLISFSIKLLICEGTTDGMPPSKNDLLRHCKKNNNDKFTGHVNLPIVKV